MYQRLISLMPAHHNYLELFVGKGKVLREKRRAPGLNVGCDVDAGVIDWWRRRPTPSWLTVLQEDALRILTSHPTVKDLETLLYLDPPYMRNTRTKLIYDHEFETEEQHRSLLKIIKRLPCMVMISGYSSSLYSTMLDGWRVVRFPATTRGGLRWEYVWLNFPAGLPLHDPRFVGDDYRERDRIKQKRLRWQAKFAAMPADEREVIRQALDAAQMGRALGSVGLISGHRNRDRVRRKRQRWADSFVAMSPDERQVIREALDACVDRAPSVLTISDRQLTPSQMTLAAATVESDGVGLTDEEELELATHDE